MTRLKKLSLFICSFMLVLTGLFFVGCQTPDYSNVTVSSSVGNNLTINTDEEVSIRFTINNFVSGMNGKLSIEATFDTTECFEYEADESQNGVTSVLVKGKAPGGKARLRATTFDGTKSCEVEITVRAYSDEVANNDTTLYLTETSPLIPSSGDFVFNDNATNRDLNFYFYGVTVPDGGSLTLEKLESENAFLRKFKKVSIFTHSGNEYLLFEDDNGNLFTVQNASYSDVNNTPLVFIPVSRVDEQYFISGDPKPVSLGEKFTFIALYNDNMNRRFFAERDFYYLKNLNGNQVEYSYQFASSRPQVSTQKELILIPNKYEQTGNNYVDYSQLNLFVNFPSISDMVEVDYEVPKANDIEILNIVKNKSNIDIASSTTTHNFSITNLSTTSVSSVLKINFYYKGFKNSTDKNVNYCLEIPVKVMYEPKALLVNNDADGRNTYSFYNQYFSDYGWQYFNVEYTPNDSAFDNLEVTFNPQKVELRYKNTTYRDTSNRLTSMTVTIDKLDAPLLFRGKNDAALTPQNLTEYINLKLNYTILQTNSIECRIPYKIVEGATEIEYVDNDHLTYGIYAPLSDKFDEFLGLKTAAKFSSISFRFSGNGSDVVELRDNGCVDNGDGTYRLSIRVRGKAIGEGQYDIILDNGYSQKFTFRVIESLDYVEADVFSDDGSVTLTQNTPQIGEVGDANYQRAKTLLYIKNRVEGGEVVFGQTARVVLEANGRQISNAITSVSPTITGNIFTVNSLVQGNIALTITTQRYSGTGTIVYRINGNKVVDFKSEPTYIEYEVEVISYNTIEGLSVLKTQDGLDSYKENTSAGYVTVYYGTNNTEKKTAILKVQPRVQGFLFFDPARASGDLNSTSNYVAEAFSNRFVSWRVDGVGDMIYDPNSSNNVYTIPGVGTFDTSTLTFEGFDYEFSIQMTATVRQFDKPYSFTVSITSLEYHDVEDLSLQDALLNSTLNFTSIKTTKTVTISTTPRGATNPSIDKVKTLIPFVTLDDGRQVEIDLFGQDGIDIKPIENNGVKTGDFIVTFTIDPSFISSPNSKLNENFEETIVFASADWIEGGSVKNEYLNSCVTITARFANGTERAPYQLENAQDVVDIRNAPSAYYKISTSIDLSTATFSPIPSFSGSIVGEANAGSSIQPQITGFKITSGNANNYGFFSTIEEGAVINGVKFKGSFEVTTPSGTATSSIGLLAGVNNGTLINVGVEFDGDSRVVISEESSEDSVVRVGGAIGQNNGTITQDYRVYTQNTNKILTPNIFMYGGVNNQGTRNKLIISPLGTINTNVNLYVGGVTGLNEGDITKIDQDQSKMRLFGYADYLAYLDIEVSGNNKNNIGMVAGQSNGGIVGLPYTYVEGGDERYAPIGSTTAGAMVYQAGRGIVVGGSIIDTSLANMTESLNYTSFTQNIGGIAGVLGASSGNNVTFGENFTGITSRVSVLGTINVGLIAGYTYAERSSALNTPALAVQAVDSGKEGLYASMLARIYRNADRLSSESPYLDTREIANLEFGGHGGTSVTYLTNGVNLFSYVNRTQLPSFTTTADSKQYYGDFVVSRGFSTINGEDPLVYLDNGYVSFEFEKDSDNLSVSANLGFGQFKFKNADGEIKTANNVFYMHYFTSNGFTYDENSDITESQSLLDEYFNSITPNHSLYPLVISSGLVLNSLSSDILTIDQSGRITASQKGLAKIRLSSILDVNNAQDFYIYVVDYFNIEKNKSIIYPTTSTSTTPLEDTGSGIEINGDSTLSVYVLPYSDGIIQVDENEVRLENGVLNGFNTNIRLNSNELISSNVNIYRLDGENKIPVYSSVEKVENPEVNVSITGQTITLSHNAITKPYYGKDIPTGEESYTYLVEFSPILRVTIPDDDFEYLCDVNKKLDKVELRYLKGAKSIKTEHYNTVTLFTSNEANDNVVVTSTREENVPYYVLENQNGDVVWSTHPTIRPKQESEDQVFTITFGEVKTGEMVRDLREYTFPMKIKFNTKSKLYQNRYEQNIYGKFILTLYASTDTSKLKEVTINFERTTVQNITIDNYSDISTANDFSSTSKVGIPGRTGLIAITLTPQDCDFDYITIENDTLNSFEGNGEANFSLVAYPNTDSFEFISTPISGSSVGKTVVFSLEDILKAYNETTYTEDGKAVEVKPYDGVIYIQYNIGTHGVGANGRARFNVTITNGDQLPLKEYIDLELKLEYRANVDLVGKTPIKDDSAKVHAIYQVARGLKYELSLDDIWGFSKESVELSLSNDALGEIIEENGKYYLQVTNDDLIYGENPYISFNIIARARQKDGEIERDVTSYTTIQILDYVVNYNSTNDYSDVVREMDNGQINVRIGNGQSLAVNLYDYIEYNHSNNSVASRVADFVDNMTKGGVWKLYTNIDANGVSTNARVTVENASSVYTLGEGVEISNIPYAKVSGLNVLPRTTHNGGIPFYMFSYCGYYRIVGGHYEAVSTSENRVYTELSLNVFQASSDDKPIPIDNYADFMDMQRGGNYILTNDIVIPNIDEAQGEAFQPISVAISSLDGNDFKIIFAGRYDFGTSDVMALFREVSADTILKNITIEVADDVVFETSSTQAFTAALLAGTNLGVVTNCNVVGGYDEELDLKYYFSAQNRYLNNQSYVVGLVGSNTGSITNSRSSVNIRTPYNASGLVGTNSGKIASSYFKGGTIDVTGSGHYMAGLVVNNSENGQIITSYVSGLTENRYIFSRDLDNLLISTDNQAGFVYSNAGTISDCYSNIQITGSSNMAGFVFENGGQITNCFSLSILQDMATSSAGFAMTNGIEGRVGSFKNCYYFRNLQSDIASGEGYIDESIGTINSSLNPTRFEGVEALNRKGFSTQSKEFDERFGSYAVLNTNTANTNSVWFYSPTTSSSQGLSEFGGQTFNGERLELVSANIIASSRRNLAEDLVTEDENGEKDYVYEYDMGYPSLGSLNNPYLIRNYSDLENLMQEGKTLSGYNYKNYRIVDDISYSGFVGSSKLYEVWLAGRLEGNGMDVRGLRLGTADKLESAGMFAGIGRDVINTGVVMNLNIYPSSDIVFTNTPVVGGLAGRLNYGYIFNVHVTRDDNEVNVAGENFVGGLIGLAENEYKIFNSSSDLSAEANYKPSSSTPLDSYEDSNLGVASFSYAGGLVGYASGRGTINTITIDEIEVVMGANAGLVFGGLGREVSAQKISVSPRQNTIIRAYKYGGFVVGESRGNLDLVTVNSSGNALAFELVPSVPTAVGGVAGVMQGGSITRVDMQQSFTAGAVIGSSSLEALRVDYVGGVVGLVQNYNANFSQILVSAEEIIANYTLGGVIGSATAFAELNEVAVKCKELSVSGYASTVEVGGMIGQVGTARASIYDSYCWSKITVDCYAYATPGNYNVGGFIGDGLVSAMERCYFSGNIDVTLVDKRVSGEATEVTEQVLTENQYVAFQTHTQKGGANNISSGEGDIKDVYYLGYQDEKGEKLDGNDAITYKSNSAIAEMTLHYTAIGLDSHNYLTNMSNNNAATNDEKVLYNLFDYYIFGKDKDIEFFYSKVDDAFYEVGENKNGSDRIAYTYDEPNKQYITESDILPKSFLKSDAGNYVGGSKERGHDKVASTWLISTETDGGLSTLRFENDFEKWFS